MGHSLRDAEQVEERVAARLERFHRRRNGRRIDLARPLPDAATGHDRPVDTLTHRPLPLQSGGGPATPVQPRGAQ
ncbi:hypothetical protein [Streptomyces cyaneofuscatus]